MRKADSVGPEVIYIGISFTRGPCVLLIEPDALSSIAKTSTARPELAAAGTCTIRGIFKIQ